jgi:transcriptional regulator with XRE-family HTH domain
MPDKNLLRSYIAKAGLTQRKLAAIIGMSENTLSSRMSGKTQFNTAEIENICDVLGIKDGASKASIFLPGTS